MNRKPRHIAISMAAEASIITTFLNSASRAPPYRPQALHQLQPSTSPLETSLAVHHPCEIRKPHEPIAVGIHAADHSPAFIDGASAIAERDEHAEELLRRDHAIAVGVEHGERVTELVEVRRQAEGSPGNVPELIEAYAAIAVAVDICHHQSELFLGRRVVGAQPPEHVLELGLRDLAVAITVEEAEEVGDGSWGRRGPGVAVAEDGFGGYGVVAVGGLGGKRRSLRGRVGSSPLLRFG